MDGNEAVARGAMKAGCRFFAGYPITPATTIFAKMLELLPPSGGVCLQGENEIASIGYCLGASMAGMKAMTATSGPGISLYSEQISFAVGSEIPIVIVNVQRLGPSTGSATLGADGDVNFMRWGNSGGFPVIVLAPSDAGDCYALTVHAFNLAETFRCPVFLASNKEIGMTKESVDMDALELPEITGRQTADPESPHLPFETRGRMVPDFLHIGGRTLVRQTSSTHGANGYITSDPAEISEIRHRLKDKIESETDRFDFHRYCPAAGADTLVIVYGVTARAALAAQKALEKDGRPVSVLVLKTLWPVPENLIREKAARYRRILVVEMNLGQYVREIERVLGNKQIAFQGEMDGKLITPNRIREAIVNG